MRPMAAAPIAEIAAAFRAQAQTCRVTGSGLYAELLGRAAQDLAAGGALAALFQGWSGEVQSSQVALRFAGGLHWLALEGRAPALSAQFPSTGGAPDAGLWAAVMAAAMGEPETMRRFLAGPPQTNEAGRSAALLGGFLRVARLSGLPLATREVGASAGLNLHWHRYAYRLGGYRWGPSAAPALRLDAEWRGPAADFELNPRVVSTAGCDLAPLDPADGAARRRLEAFVWADQLPRLATLRRALDYAAAAPERVERASAAAWVARQLAARPEGAATVVYHSVVRQYFDPAEGAAFDAAIAAAGEAADTSRPVAWLRLEQSGPNRQMELRLRYWPGGGAGADDRPLALTHPHGAWVEWRG